MSHIDFHVVRWEMDYLITEWKSFSYYLEFFLMKLFELRLSNFQLFQLRDETFGNCPSTFRRKTAEECSIEKCPR